MTEYSYSYNGSNYRGNFSTREEALSAALKGIGGLDVLPEAIYVGRRVPADPHASGLARPVLAAIRAQAADDLGNADYLTRITPAQLSSLDSALETAVLGWLSKNDLLSGQFRIDSVSEHPAPTVPQTHTQTPAEVTSLGVEE
jgi:hypothetical protein